MKRVGISARFFLQQIQSETTEVGLSFNPLYHPKPLNHDQTFTRRFNDAVVIGCLFTKRIF